MIETRSYKINYRIFTQEDIKKIASELEKEYKKAMKDKKFHCSLNFSIYYNDGSNYETEDTKLFDSNVISAKKVSKIKFRFIDYRRKNSISLELTHGDKYYTNELQISGSDSDWVNGSLTRLKELIESSHPQFNLMDKFSSLFIILFSFSIGFLFFFIIVSAFRLQASKPLINPFNLFSNDLSNLVALLSLVYITGVFPAMSVVGWLKQMFPNIEIQIGPNHSFIESNRRKVLWGVVTIVMIPLVFLIFG